jgi:hypothetical protein
MRATHFRNVENYPTCSHCFTCGQMSRQGTEVTWDRKMVRVAWELYWRGHTARGAEAPRKEHKAG